MKRGLLAALVLIWTATSSLAADMKEFAVRGGSGAYAYQGIVRVSPIGGFGNEALFLNVEWTIGTYVFKGYGIVATDDPQTLTVSYIVPAGLGVGRYRTQPDGGFVGALVGDKGIFVQEVWTPLAQ